MSTDQYLSEKAWTEAMPSNLWTGVEGGHYLQIHNQIATGCFRNDVGIVQDEFTKVDSNSFEITLRSG